MSLLDKAGLQELWGKIKNLVSSTTYTKTSIDTQLSGKKSTQNDVSDPTASGTAVEFISGISQNAQGVISPSKKTVRTMGGASASAAGSTGLVPAPASGEQAQFLRGDGTWQTPTHQTIKQDGVTGATANRYATCTTEAGTAAKTATITTGTFTLEAGATVYVKFTNSNTATLPTLNVNGTGAKSIMRYGTTHAGTLEATSWVAGAVVPFTYDGTYWIMQSTWDNNTTYSNESLGQGYGTCTTEAATAAKVVTLSSYALIKGGVVSVKFTNSVPASATMSINSKGAKAIFYQGAAITAGVIKAGDLATFIYDGTQYHLLSIDRWGTESGNVDTVNGVSPDSSKNVQIDADDISQSAITETGVDSVDDALDSLSQQIGEKENKLIGRTVAISAATSSGTIGSISGDSAITSSMVVVASTITNPEYQTSNWTIDTSNGGLTITGTASAATSVYIVLAEV